MGITAAYTADVSLVDTRMGLDRPRTVTFRIASEEYGRRGWRIDRHDFGPMWSAASPQVFATVGAAKAAFAAAVGQPGAFGLERWQVVQPLGGKRAHLRNPLHLPKKRAPAARRNPAEAFKEGDLVRHTTAFRKSTGMYKGNIDGVVVGHATGSMKHFPIVAWSDGGVSPINPVNIEHKKAATWTPGLQASAVVAGKAAYRKKVRKDFEADEAYWNSPEGQKSLQDPKTQAFREKQRGEWAEMLKNPRGAVTRHPAAKRTKKRNPQRSFNPVDYHFRWTKDWYEWDRTAAVTAARQARDAEAKRLKALGHRVVKWSLPGQRITRGGIGSGHPQIEHVVTSYMLDWT
jgi:hypothetical protein